MSSVTNPLTVLSSSSSVPLERNAKRQPASA